MYLIYNEDKFCENMKTIDIYRYYIYILAAYNI